MKCVLKTMKYAKMSHKRVIYKLYYSTQGGVPIIVHPRILASAR